MPRSWVRRLCPGCGLLAILLACGGGGGGGTPAPSPALALTSAPPTSAIEAHPYRYAASATNPNGGTLQFSLVAAPAGATLTGSTVDWAPGPADVGTSSAFKIRVADGKSAVEQAWTVTVNANRPPAFQGAAPTLAKEGHAYVYDLAATDADGDPVQFEATQLPPAASLSGARLTWTPAAGDVGQSVDLKVRALDGFGGTTDQAWSLTPAANAAPLITSQPPTDVTFVQAKPVFDYALAGTDADQDLLTFSLVQGPAGATLVNGILHWEPTPDQERVAQTFQVRVSDGCGGVVDQQWTKAYSGVLRGTWADLYLSASGTTVMHTDASIGSADLTALIPDGAGGFRTIRGALNPDGTLSLPGIPPGSYWLHLGTKGFIWTDRGTIDAGARYLGRPDAVRPTSSAYLNLTLGNLDSWTDQEGLIWQVPNHAFRTGFDSRQFTSNGPVAGDTGLASALLQHMSYAPLVEAAKSDALMLLQPASAQQGAFLVRTIRKSFTTDTLTEVSGGNVPVTGTFIAPPDASVDLYWDATREAAYRTQVRPDAMQMGPSLYVDVQSGGFSQGWLQEAGTDPQTSYDSHPFLLSISGPAPTQPIHQVFGFRDPYPAAWPRVYIASTNFSISITSNGNQGGLSGAMSVISDSPGTAGSPLAALVSPVQHPTLGGKDFFADQVGVGTTPILAWDPPALGSPVCYLIRIMTVVPTQSGGLSFGTDSNSVMKVFGTSVQIPPGALVPGTSYVIEVRAVVTGPGYDPAVPGRFPLPMGFAPCFSGLIQP